MKDILDLMQERHSARVPYDPNRPATKQQLEQIVEAASWAPTAHNMQNFEIVVVDDPAILQAIGAIKTKISAVFLRENFQLAASWRICGLWPNSSGSACRF
jgi:nitroreductase